MRHFFCTFLLSLLSAWPACGQAAKSNSSDPANGRVERLAVASGYVNGRNVDVWLPEGYCVQKRYAVLYMHDGQMLFDNAETWNKKTWHAGRTIQQLIDQGKVQDVIVVGIWNNDRRYSEYFPQKALDYVSEPKRSELLGYMPGGPLADAYLKFITGELKPLIDSTYSTHPDRNHTFIAGSSMGGLISLYALCEYPDIFAGAGCISTHWIGTLAYNREIPEALIHYLSESLPPPGQHRIYFDHGTLGLDAHYADFQKIADQTLKLKKYDERYTLSLEFADADHNEDAWAARFVHPVTFLLARE